MLSARILDTLLCLVERPGELVDKQHLLNVVWPDVVVEENNLTQAISTLRRALGEQPRKYRYIETVSGRGYRFVAKIEPVVSDGDEEVVAERGTSSTRIRNTVVFIGVVTFIAAIIFSRWIITSGGDAADDRIQVVEQELITRAPADHRQPTLSPDGSMVAYVSDLSGTDQIYVQNLADGGPHAITELEGGVGHPSWSPRNDRIIFHSLTHGGIWSVGTLGDPPPRLLIPEGRNPSYSFDGSTIVYEHGHEIRIAESDGSQQRKIPGFSARGWLTANLYPSPSPDGDAVVVLRAENTPLGDYWVVPVDGSNVRQLTFDRTEGGRPYWAADGYVYMASERGGTRSIWRVPGDGGAPQAITTSTGMDGDPVLSRDGSRLVYASTRLETRFIVRNTVDGSRQEVYRSLAKSSFPMVSRDRSRLAFFQKSDPEEQLFIMDVDRWEALQLTHSQNGERRIMPRWSHDDSELIFYEVSADQTAQDLRALPVDGGPSRQVFSEFPWIGNMDIEWSPTGDRAVFSRRDVMDPMNDATTRVVIRNFASGHDTEFHWPIRYGPAWSADGQHVLGASAEGVHICTVSTGECGTIDTGTDANDFWAVGGLGHYARWSSDESRVFFNRRSQRPGILELWVVDRDGNNARRLFEYGPVDPLDGRFQVLSDDRILWNELVPSHRAELWSATINRSDSEDADPTHAVVP